MSKHKLKICVVSSSRADYGLLYWPLKAIQQDAFFELQLIVTGSHLNTSHGLTGQAIEADGFPIAKKIELPMGSDSHSAIASSMAAALMGITAAIDELKPDCLLLLGDRYEIFSAAQAAMVCNVPIAHIAGGDTTQGAIDEAIRHSITKMSHIHFATNEQSAQRVRQLGEHPERVFNVGSPGIDFIRNLKLLNKDNVEQRLEFKLKQRNLLITFHPTTLEPGSAKQQVTELLNALTELGPDVGLIFTMPNADLDSDVIAKLFKQFSATNSSAKLFTSLGQELYLSTLSLVDAVVGNSSSGLYEAPSFKKPTINIGNRQKGRLQADSILDCQPTKNDILETINQAFDLDCSKVTNPYGDGKSSQRIVSILKNIDNYKSMLNKEFCDQMLPTVVAVK